MDRGLRELGISLPGDTTDTTTADTASEYTTVDNITIDTIDAQVNPYHDVIDLSLP